MIDPATGMWVGAWPPDPSWDEDPMFAAPPILPPPADSPVPDGALAMPVLPPGAEEQGLAQAPLDPAVQLGMPRPVAEPMAPPIDEDLIGAYEEPTEGDLSYVTGFGETTQGVPPLDQELAAPAPHVSGADYSGAPEEAARVAGLSSAELALEQFDANQAAEQQAAGQRMEAVKAEHRGARFAEDTYRKAMERAAQKRAAIDAESERLATERVDPDGWRNSRNLFQTISMYVAGIVGGLVQSRQGGPNQGLAMINQAIDQHIDAQKANLAHRRQMLGDRRAALGEDIAQADHDHITEQAFRQAAYQRALADVEADKAQYDPNGNAFRQRTMFQRQIEAEMAARRDAAIRAEEDRQIKIGEFDLKVFKENEAKRHNLVTEAAAARKAAGAGVGGTSASKVKKTAAEWNAGIPGAAVFDDGSPLTFAEYRARGEGAKSLTAPTEAEKEIRDLAIGDPRRGGEPLKQKNNSIYIPPAHAAPALQKQMSAATQVTDIAYAILSIRDQVGGESKAFNSDHRQRLDALQNQLVILQKSGTEGMSSDEDMKKLAAAVGAADVASFRSQAAGLKQGIINTENALNASLRAAKYNGEAVKFPNQHAKAKQTPDQRELARIKASETGEKGQIIPTAAVASPLGAVARAVESAVRDEDAGAKLPEDDKTQIDSWAKDARAGDADARSSIAELAQDDTRSPAVKKYARGLLADIEAKELAKATGKKPGDKGFLKALRTAVGYTADAPEDDEETEE